jgi:hypothetical protein
LSVSVTAHSAPAAVIRLPRATAARRAFAGRAAAVVVFAVAMAYVESACVLYLRTLYCGIDPAVRGGRAVSPLVPNYLGVEVGREAATMVMLAAVGWVAGRRPAARFGYFVAAFGVWDVWYYLWLRVFSGWPAGPLDWDVLFLIPLPWWGPVITPAIIACEMAAGGLALAWLADVRGTVRRSSGGLALFGAGIVILLVAFMWDALLGLAGLRSAVAVAAGSPLPARFPWEVFLAGDAVGLAGLAFILRAQRPRPDQPA